MINTMSNREAYIRILDKSLPPNTRVEGNLDLNGHSGLITLPDNLTINGDLDAYDCVNLIALPNNLVITHSLNVEGCTRLETIPNTLAVCGHVFIAHHYFRLRDVNEKMLKYLLILGQIGYTAEYYNKPTNEENLCNILTKELSEIL